MLPHGRPAIGRIASVLVLSCLLGLAGAASAFDPSRSVRDLVIDHWGTTEGLRQATVASIAQDSVGYLWLGTFGGLARFDGDQFTTFHRHNSPVSVDIIYRVAAGRDGEVWFMAERSLGRRDRDGSFSTFNAHDGIPDTGILAVMVDSKGTPWVGTGQGAVVRRVGDRFVELGGAAEVVRRRTVWSLLEDRHGRIWFASGGGLGRWDGARLEAIPTASGESVSVASLLETRGGRILAGTDHNVLEVVDDRLVPIEGLEKLSSTLIVDLAEEANGAIWIATNDRGLGRFADGRLEMLTEHDGLASDGLHCLLLDREGSLWVGSNGGLDRLREAPIALRGAGRGLPAEFARAIVQAVDGAVWVATSGGLARGQGDRFVAYGPETGLPEVSLLSLAIRHAGGIWVGTRGHGYGRFVNGRFVRGGSGGPLANASVQAMLEDPDGTLWIVAGVGLFRVRGESIVAVPTDRRWTRGSAPAIARDRKGRLWVGTSFGPFLLEGDALHSKSAEFPHRTVLSINPDEDGRLWFGTEEGVCLLDDDDHFLPVDLSIDPIFRVLPDGLGNLWASSNFGLIRIPRAELLAAASGPNHELNVSPLGRAAGLADSRLNGNSQPAGWRLANGELWFPAPSGVAVVEPSFRPPPNPIPPPIVIDAPVADGRVVPASETVVLDPGVRRLSFHYAVLTFLGREAVASRYRLAGWDHAWQDDDGSRSASYTNLGPGRFDFKVEAANADGIWNREGARMTVVIRPFFWQTRWFRLLLGLAFVTAIYGFLKLRTRRLELRQRVLRRAVAERTSQLQVALGEKAELLVQVERQRDMFEELSRVDALTELANRRELDARLADEVERAHRYSHPLAFAIADADHFKRVNDAHSHQIGDEVLRTIARLVSAGIRSVDVAARYGGEEFGILMPVTTLAEAVALSERIRADVESHDWSTIAPGLSVTISIGISGDISDGVDGLLASADRALYRAKNGGRNRVEVDAPGADVPTSRGHP